MDKQDKQALIWSPCLQVQDAVHDWARTGQVAYPSYVMRNTRQRELWDAYLAQNPGILR